MSTWKSVPLSEIAESVDYGVTASATMKPLGPKFLRITDIQDGGVNWDTVPWCECDARSTADSKLRAGDIVFARTGATTGKSYLIRNCPTDAVFASYLIRVRLNAQVEPRYVSHYFQTPEYWAQITKSARGVAQPGVNATTLKSLLIPFPTIAEQRRIADILDRLDAIRTKRHEAIAKATSLEQSTFLEMFGDPQSNPNNWPAVTPTEIASDERYSIAIGPFGSSLLTSDYRDAGVPLVFVRNIRERVFNGSGMKYVSSHKAEELRAHQVNGRDVLMTKMGDPPGDPAVYPENCPAGIITADCIKLTLNEKIADPHFVCALFDTSAVRAQVEAAARGVAQKKINLSLFKSLRLFLPPLELQKLYFQRINSVREFIGYQNKFNALSGEAVASIQQRAFNGEL